MPSRIMEADETVCACMGAPTRTISRFPTDMEECVYCETAVAWDKVNDPFWGFGDKPCEHAKTEDE